MNKHIAAMMTYFKDNQVKHEDQEQLVSFVASHVIASQLPMPTSPLTSVRMHYTDNVAPMAKEMLEEFNQHYTLRYGTTLRLIQKLWMTRYNFVYKPLAEESLSMVRQLLENDDVRKELPGEVEEMLTSVKDVASTTRSVAYHIHRIFVKEEQ